MGLSLWLVPSREEAQKLSRIMSMRTENAKSPSSYPHFDPHITLATAPSTTSISDLRAALPSGQVKVPIHFKSVDVGEKYFMSVYVAVHRSSKLVALREALKRNLGEKTVPPLAHLSLFYIDDSDADEREKAAEVLQREGRVIPDGDESVTLDCSEGDERGKDLISGFEGAEIWIALCDGPVPGWVVKDKVQL